MNQKLMPRPVWKIDDVPEESGDLYEEKLLEPWADTDDFDATDAAFMQGYLAA